MGHKARETVLDRYTTLNTQNEAYDSFIRSQLTL